MLRPSMPDSPGGKSFVIGVCISRQHQRLQLQHIRRAVALGHGEASRALQLAQLQLIRERFIAALDQLRITRQQRQGLVRASSRTFSAARLARPERFFASFSARAGTLWTRPLAPAALAL
jgi:hypothetical protein